MGYMRSSSPAHVTFIQLHNEEAGSWCPCKSWEEASADWIRCSSTLDGESSFWIIWLPMRFSPWLAPLLGMVCWLVDLDVGRQSGRGPVHTCMAFRRVLGLTRKPTYRSSRSFKVIWYYEQSLELYNMPPSDRAEKKETIISGQCFSLKELLLGINRLKWMVDKRKLAAFIT